MTEADLVEKVARAIDGAFMKLEPGPWDWKNEARAVIPIIEANLLRDFQRWTDEHGWSFFGSLSPIERYARERGLEIGE